MTQSPTYRNGQLEQFQEQCQERFLAHPPFLHFQDIYEGNNAVIPLLAVGETGPVAGLEELDP